jgi:hypothetical protein
MSLKAAIILSILGTASLATSALAQSVKCTMDSSPARYYIAPEVSLVLGDFGEVAVRDAIIASTGRKMVPGSVATDDAKRLSILWEVRDPPTNPAETRAHGAHLLVRLSIQKSDGKARMTVLDVQARRRQSREYRTTGACSFAD